MDTTRIRTVRGASLGLILLVSVLMIGAVFVPHGTNASTPGAPHAALAAVATVHPAQTVAPAHAAHPASGGRALTTSVVNSPTGVSYGMTAADPAAQSIFSVSSDYDYTSGSNFLSEYNLTTGAPIGTPVQLVDPAAAAAWGIAYDPVQNTLFIAFQNSTGGFVLVVNAATMAVVANLSTFPADPYFTPSYVMFDPSTDQVFVENWTNLDTAIINTTTNTVSQVIFITGCTYCYPEGFIDVWTNDYILLPSDTNYLPAINTSLDGAAVGLTYGADTSFYSGPGVLDNYSGLIWISNESYAGDVAVFYTDGTFYFDLAGPGPNYANAAAYNWQDDLVVFSDYNGSVGGGDELWSYFDLFGVLWQHVQNPTALYDNGDYFTTLESVTEGANAYLVTGGPGNATWLLTLDQITGNYSWSVNYPSSPIWSAYVVADPVHDRYYVLSEGPAVLSAYNDTTNVLVWSDNLGSNLANDYEFVAAVDTEQGYIYVSDTSTLVTVYSAATGTFVTSMTFAMPILTIVVDPVHHLLYAAQSSGYNVYEVDILANADTLDFTLVGATYPCGETAVPATDEVAVVSCSTGSNSTVTLYSGATGNPLGNFSVWGYTVYGLQMAVDTAGNLYVPLEYYNVVTVYNTNTQEYVGNWTTGSFQPYGVAVDKTDGIVLLTGDYSTSELMVLNASTGAVTSTIGLPSPSYGLPTFSNDTGTFFSPLFYTGQTAVTKLVPLPTVPGGLTASAGNTTAALTWTASTGASGYPVTGYNVLWSTAAIGPWTAGPSATGLSATVSGLTDGTTYYFVVEATSSAGNSPVTASKSATPLGVPYPPQTLTLSVGSSSSLNASWTAPAHMDGAAVTNYTVDYSSAAAGPWTAKSAGTSTTFEISGLTASTTYYVKVVAWNSVGQSNPSTPASAATKSSGGGGGGGGGGSTSSSSVAGLSTLDLAILVIVILAVIGAIVGVMMMRRKRGGSPPTGPAATPPGAWTPPPGQWSPPPSGGPAPPPAPPSGGPPTGPPPGAQ
ncbi:MAG: fibronectin type III domain-containing protein [Thermoplasmata archaeon]|nr:fibronectin type III domain-containing protein [Thermoplasmata archaeon]